MIPIGKGQGELRKGNTLLCNVDYDISPELPHIIVAGTQQIRLQVHAVSCEKLLTEVGLTLILADGSCHWLPRLLHFYGSPAELGYFVSPDL